MSFEFRMFSKNDCPQCKEVIPVIERYIGLKPAGISKQCLINYYLDADDEGRELLEKLVDLSGESMPRSVPILFHINKWSDGEYDSVIMKVGAKGINPYVEELISAAQEEKNND